MKNTRSRWSRLAMIVLSLAVVTVFSMPTVFADGNGSMLLDFTTSHGEKVEGAPFDLYKVADLDKDGKVTTVAETFTPYADQIKALEPIKDPKSTGAGEWTKAAALLADYVTIQNIKPMATEKTKANGTTAFGGLADGRYLVVGKPVEKTVTNADGTTVMMVYTGNPFLADIQGEPRTAKIKPDEDEKTDLAIKAKKKWTDGDDNNREVKFQLYKNKDKYGDPKTVDKNTKWETTPWTNLPINDENNNKIKWTVKEEPVSGYSASDPVESKEMIDGVEVICYTITNSPDSPGGNHTNLSVKKEWVGDEENVSSRPSSIQVQLMRNGKPYRNPVTLNEKNGWEDGWDSLPGTAKDYSVVEVSVPDYYTAMPTYPLKSNAIVLTNTYIPPDNPDIPDDPTPLGPPGVDYTVQKVWEDKGYETKRPASIDVVLLKNGVEYNTQTLNEANGWKYTWTDLDGEATWEIKEKSVPAGYEVKTSLENYTVTMTNTYNPENKTTPPSGTTKKTGKLPQTGMLWWPVPVLGCAGLLLILLGLVRKNKRRRTDGE